MFVSALYTGHAKLYDFSSNTSSIGPDLWPTNSPDFNLLQNMGHHLTASLSFNVNELRWRLLSA